MKRIIILALLTVSFQCAFATVYYVSTSGNDGAGNGSSGSPWRTLKFAVTKVPANQGHVIKLSAGTFVESGQFNVPPGVSVEGSGVDQTIIKAASSFYFNPGDPGFAIDRFLMGLISTSQTSGNQSLKNFTVDGDGKRLHGGIYVKFRNNVTVENVKVQYTNFCGIWMWDTKNSSLKDVKLVNCSWGSTGWASGALQLANLDGMTIDNLNVDENTGYGIKALGSGGNKISNMKVFDSRISVNPAGKWNNGSAPNIAFELWEVLLTNCEIYNTYMDNHLSLVNLPTTPTGGRSIRVHHNTFDLKSRAGGHGYGIELTINDAEIDHNWFNGGSYAIANWSPTVCSNWLIHHNTVNSLNSGWPGTVLRSQVSGLHNVKFYNNTIQLSGTTTINVIGLHAGKSDNVEIKNNLFIDANTSYSYWPNPLIFMEGGATMSGLRVTHNLFQKMPVGNISGGSYSNNLTIDPQITKSGVLPAPYFVPKTGSPLINAGTNVGLPFQGSAPDIGAYETGGTTTPVVAVTGISVTPGTVNLTTNATSQLTHALSPSNATNKTVTWTSSNPGVATVSATGLVTAKSAGSATITVKTADGGKTAIATVTVAVPVVTVTSVTIAPSTITLPLNSTSQLANTISPSNATNKSVTWSSSNTSVAAVSTTGIVTAKAYGTAVLSCKTVDGSKVGTASLTVSANVASVDIDNATRGTGTNQFNFIGSGWTHGVSTGDPYFNKTLSFSNVANNSATVSFSGNKVELYSAKASHHGIVAVSIDNGPETMVDLYSSTRQNFVLVYGSAVLSQGTHTIKMRVTGKKNSAATGAYTILDYMKVYSGSTSSVSSVSVMPGAVTMELNGTSQLSKSISPSTAGNQNVTWSSSNVSVATVSATGLVTAIGSGTATITVKTVDGGKTATASVTVNTPSNAVDFDNGNRGTAANQFNFSGSGWAHGVSTSDPYLNQTLSYSNVANNYVTVSFVGNKVEFYTSKASHHGIVAVSIDNGAEKNVDLYSASRQSFAMVYSSGTLTQGTHTIKIRVTGTKNAAATGTYAIIDYIKVYSTAVGGGGGANAPEATAAIEEETAQPMEYYPNPLRSGDVLHVNLPAAAGEVTLMDLAGVPQLTFTVTDTALQIPTSGLFKGIYLLQYRTEKGREVVKIMVQ